MPLHGTARLGEDGLVAGAAAAPDRAAAAVEEADADIVPAENLHQPDFGAVELVAGGEKAAVFVAVGIAEHDLLGVAALGQQIAVEGE